MREIKYEVIDGVINKVEIENTSRELTPIMFPAVLFDEETGVLHAIGDITSVKAKYNKFVEAMRNSSASTIFDSLCLIEFKSAFDLEWLAQEMTAMLNCSGYVQAFLKKAELIHAEQIENKESEEV